jgi:hypothetical protein
MISVYLYNIGYGTCEESSYKQYSHEKKFSEQELRDIVKECIIAVIEHYAGRFGKGGYHETCFHVSDSGPQFDEIMNEPMFEELLIERGFNPSKFEARFDTFGWASAMDDTDWEGHTGEEDKKLQHEIAEVCRGKGIFVENFFAKEEDGEVSRFGCHRLNYLDNVFTKEEQTARRLKGEYPFEKKDKNLF